MCRRETRGQGGFPGWLVALVGLTMAGLLVYGIVTTIIRRHESISATPPPARLGTATVVASATGPRATTEAAGSTIPAWFADEQARLPEERRRVSITIYTASWCAYCRAAKAWLDNQHQPYFERDIERDADAKARMQRLNPKGGVPTIHVEDEVLIGFDAPTLDRAIDTAARRRIASARLP